MHASMRSAQILRTKTSQILESQSGSSTELIRSLRKEYEEKHTEYAPRNIAQDHRGVAYGELT